MGNLTGFRDISAGRFRPARHRLKRQSLNDENSEAQSLSPSEVRDLKKKPWKLRVCKKKTSRFWRAENWKDVFERYGLIIRFIRYGVFWLNIWDIIIILGFLKLLVVFSEIDLKSTSLGFLSVANLRHAQNY